MRQPNGFSTPSPKSSAAKQWIKEELAQKKEEDPLCVSSKLFNVAMFCIKFMLLHFITSFFNT